MAETLRIDVRTSFAGLSHKRRIHSDANDVFTRRYDRLAIATIQNKVLSGESKAIRVGPTRSDTLVSGNIDCAAVVEFSCTWRRTTDRNGIRICIEHAEPALCRTPNLAGARIDELIKCVVSKMVMAMAGSKLKESVISGNVVIRIAYEDVLISGVRRHNGKAHEFSHTGCNFAFNRATSIRRNFFIANHPLRAEDVFTNGKVWAIGWSRFTTWS